MRGSLVCLALLLGAALAANAQSAESILPPNASVGDRLAVTTTGGERFSGRLVTDSDGALVIRLSNRREQTIAHDQIERVTRRHNRFLFGPLIGLGAGLAIGLPAKTRFENEGVDGRLALSWVVGTGVAIGTVIDLVNGSDRTIYERKSGAVTGLQLQPARRGAAVRWTLAW